MGKRKLITLTALICGVYLFVAPAAQKPAAAASKIPEWYNETLTFEIVWKFLNVGSISLATTANEKEHYLDTIVNVRSFPTLQKFYYVSGKLGSRYDYKYNRSVTSFEYIYQGKKYIQRYFAFKGPKAFVKVLKRSYKEYSYPKKSKPKTRKRQKWVTAPEFKDVLGSFHYLRGLKKVYQPGDGFKIKVLPSGKRRFLVVNVKKKLKVKTRHFGEREVHLVEAGLAKVKKKNKDKEPAELFFKTKQKIYAYLTADEWKIPVKVWTSMPYLGDVEVHLKKYETTGGNKKG